MKNLKIFSFVLLVGLFAFAGIALAQNSLDVTNLTDGSEEITMTINYSDQTNEQVIIFGTESPSISTEGRTVASVTINGITCYPGGTENISVGSTEIQFSLSADAKGVVIDNISG